MFFAYLIFNPEAFFAYLIPNLSSWSPSFIPCRYLPARIIPTLYHYGHELSSQIFLTIYFRTRFFCDKKFCINIICVTKFCTLILACVLSLLSKINVQVFVTQTILHRAGQRCFGLLALIGSPQLLYQSYSPAGHDSWPNWTNLKGLQSGRGFLGNKRFFTCGTK